MLKNSEVLLNCVQNDSVYNYSGQYKVKIMEAFFPSHAVGSASAYVHLANCLT